MRRQGELIRATINSIQVATSVTTYYLIQKIAMSLSNNGLSITRMAGTMSLVNGLTLLEVVPTSVEPW